ncbi:thioesterase II family protein [Streptomyces sp. NPDC003691]
MTAGSTAATSPWFIRPPSDGPPARLFCFPFAGGGASAFSAWPAVIGDTEVCPVQFPGRENRLAHPHYGTYENLADGLAEALTPFLDRPFALFGHCAGALAAYETAVRLDRLGLPAPERLVVSGQPAPHHTPYDPMLAMTEPELRAGVESYLRSRGIEPRPDMTGLGLAVLLRDRDAAAAYRRTEPAVVRCPIDVLHWRDDTGTSPERLRDWCRYTETAELHVLDGGHHDFAGAPAGLRRSLTRWR